MRLYELVLVLKTSLSDTDRKKLVDEVKKLLGDIKIVKEEEWGQKPLAYSIKKEFSGFYKYFTLEGENGVSNDFELSLIRNENILRSLLIRTK